MSRVLLGFVMGAAVSQASAQFDTLGSDPLAEPAKASLISLEDGFVPGGVTHLGVRFEIADHWHIYWDGLNDSGLPPAITLDLPEGFEAMPTRWPAPTRNIIGKSDLLDHVLEGEVLAVIPIRVPADATVGSTLKITGKSDWLVCDEACLPGQASLSIELPVVSKASASQDAASFRRALKRTPVPLLGDASKVGLSLAWEGRTLVVKSEHPGRIEFYPHATSTSLMDRFNDPVGDSGELRLQLETDGAITGVLRVPRADDDPRPALVAIDLAVGSTQNRRPSPAIGWRPWMESVDGPQPWPHAGGTHGGENPDGRGG